MSHLKGHEKNCMPIEGYNYFQLNAFSLHATTMKWAALTSYSRPPKQAHAASGSRKSVEKYSENIVDFLCMIAMKSTATTHAILVGGVVKALWCNYKLAVELIRWPVGLLQQWCTTIVPCLIVSAYKPLMATCMLHRSAMRWEFRWVRQDCAPWLLRFWTVALIWIVRSLPQADAGPNEVFDRDQRDLLLERFFDPRTMPLVVPITIWIPYQF